MAIEQVLQELGLSQGETKVYLALLKLGNTTVARIKEETQLHRTTIYDFLESLINKVLVSYVIKDGIKYFEAASPKHLEAYLKEKEELLRKTIPELEQLQTAIKPELKVEVYRGKKGFKTFMANLPQPKIKEFLAFGVDELKFMNKFPVIMNNYFKQEKKFGIKERIIAEEGTTFVHKASHITYKFIPKEFFPPTPTAIYGNKVGFLVWDPLNVVVIENKDLADSYRKWFNLLWKTAKHV